MLSTQQIQYILSLAELGNFSRAAEACYVTQPTLSMQIRKAEEIVGFTIFDRNRSPLELTRLGKELLPVLREIEADFHRIGRLTKQAEGNYLEEVRIGIIPTVSAYLIPALYTKWKKEMPSIRLTIEEKKSEEILDALLNNKMDVGIMAGPVAESSLRNIPLFVEEIKAFIPELKSDEISVDELKSLQPWLLNKGNCLRTQMMNFCELQEPNETNYWNYEGGNLEMLLRMVQLNGGYTLIPGYYRQILETDSTHFKSIVDTRNQDQVPARSIIALTHHKNAKWNSIELLVRNIQLNFAERINKNLFVLNWQ